MVGIPLVVIDTVFLGQLRHIDQMVGNLKPVSGGRRNRILPQILSAANVKVTVHLTGIGGNHLAVASGSNPHSHRRLATGRGSQNHDSIVHHSTLTTAHLRYSPLS